jgi:hypothetical protein
MTLSIGDKLSRYPSWLWGIGEREVRTLASLNHPNVLAPSECMVR